MAMIGIVPEELNEENYEFWKVCLKSYLVGQGLWEVVFKEATYEEEATLEWQRKNAQALHAIQLACGSRAYAKYMNLTHVSAKFAWEHLAEFRRSSSASSNNQATQLDYGLISVKKQFPYENLYKAVEDGDMEKVKEILKNDPHEAGRAILTSGGDTALHVAILSGKVKIALELVKQMAAEDLEIANDSGATPLSLTAITGNTDLARTMVQKNHKLVTIKTGNTGQTSLPVIAASVYARKGMVHYLYYKTPKELLDPKQGMDGALLLNNLITSDFFDVASMLLNRFPLLGVTPDHLGNYAIHKLANKPSAFASGNEFGFLKHWIYRCVCIYSSWNVRTQNRESINGSDHEIDINDQSSEESTSKVSLLHQLGWILLRFCVPDIKYIHDKKLVNDEASKLLSFIFMEIRGVSDLHLSKMEIGEALHRAIEHNIVEFVVELLTYNPELIWWKDERGRTIFSHAIMLRQEKIFRLFYSLGTKKSIVASQLDNFQNNFLHLAAKLSPPNQLKRVSGAALQMQRELQWYKEVESLVPPSYKDQVNEHDWKPSTLFAEEHKGLAKEAEKWMKDSAGSSMIVGILVATVTFTAVFTIPGGNNDTSGLPIMLDTDRNAFIIFMVSNGLSLFASSISVLFFLNIFTSRYAENDFFLFLPAKLILGNASLLFSIVTMMVSFAAAVYLMLHKTLQWVFIPLIVFTFYALLLSTSSFTVMIELVLRTFMAT